MRYLFLTSDQTMACWTLIQHDQHDPFVLPWYTVGSRRGERKDSILMCCQCYARDVPVSGSCVTGSLLHSGNWHGIAWSGLAYNGHQANVHVLSMQHSDRIGSLDYQNTGNPILFT